MKYLIPSKGRADSISNTIQLLGSKDVKVYVAKEDYDEYAGFVDKAMLNVIPMGTRGMGAIRKYMLNDNRDLDYFYMLDDDIKYLANLTEDKVVQIHDTKHVKQIIENVYNMANDLKTPLFGLNPTANPKYYSDLSLFSFSRPTIMGIGVIPKYLGDIDFDPRLLIFEDEDFTLMPKLRKRYHVLDLRYHFMDKKIWTSEGGCSTLRTQSVEKDCKTTLRNKWGGSVGKKEGGQFILRCPF